MSDVNTLPRYRYGFVNSNNEEVYLNKIAKVDAEGFKEASYALVSYGESFQNMAEVKEFEKGFLYLFTHENYADVCKDPKYADLPGTLQEFHKMCGPIRRY